MKTFIGEDFLLYNETGKNLYHEIAKHLPIIDYHNHLDANEILENNTFSNLAEVWLGGDHYKWRAMRANGIEESFITGNQSSYDKFLAWAKTVPKTIGNPLYHWTHLELLRYFDIDVLLNAETAPEIWKEVNRKLVRPEFSTRSLLEKMNVEFVGTTDDPTDTLDSHKRLEEENLSFKVSPSFRPDKGLSIENEEFTIWVQKLSETSGISIQLYQDFLDAFALRVAYFAERGCRSADHGINKVFYAVATEKKVAAIFQKRLKGKPLTVQEIEQFKTYTLVSLSELYANKDWAMQLHLHPLRNTNERKFQILGPDSGFDSIGDSLIAEKVAKLLNEMDKRGTLPKTILYSVHSRDYETLAAIAGNFQSDEIPGKVQLGSAWWFNDTIDGMETQLKTLANIGLISNFIGMLTDSRSFLSFPRHEYFRRILCNLLGTWVEEGKAPNDLNLLGEYVKNICYENAKRYFAI